MPPKYDKDDLGKTLDKLEAQLEKSDPAKEETTADVVKSLADVAKGAIELATDATERRPLKKARRRTVLRKNEDEHEDKDKEHEKDDDEDDDDDEDEKPQWLQNLTKEGKAEGEMKYGPDRDDTGEHMMTNAGGESHQIMKSRRNGRGASFDGMDAVDVGDYLSDQLAQQAAVTKEVTRLRRLNKSLVEGLTALHERLEVLEEHGQAQARYAAVCAKALGIMLEKHEAYLAEPVTTSKFSAMEKSVAHVQAQIDAQGGQIFEMNARNMERLSKAVFENKITKEEATFIKRTQRLPAGVSLN